MVNGVILRNSFNEPRASIIGFSAWRIQDFVHLIGNEGSMKLLPDNLLEAKHLKI